MIVAASTALGRKKQQRRQRQRGERDADGGEGAGRRRLGPGVEVDHRAGEAAGHRIAARDRGGDVRGPEADQLLVRDGCAGDAWRRASGRPRRSRRSRSARSAPPDRPAPATDRRRTPAATGAAGRAGCRRRWRPRPPQVERPDRQRRDRDRGDRAGLGERCRRRAARGRGRPGAASAPCGPRTGRPAAATPITSVGRFVAPRLAPRRARASPAASRPSPPIPRIDFTWLVAIRMPEAVMKPEITGCDRKLAMKPSRNTPITTRIRPDRKASTTAAAAYSAGPASAELADRGGGHQRDHRHRPDRERAAGAEDRVGDERQDRGVEADLRRQPGQQRVGERLRDQHDRDDHRGDEVAGQRGAANSSGPSRGSADGARGPSSIDPPGLRPPRADRAWRRSGRPA